MKTLSKALILLLLIVGAAFYLTQPLALTGTPVNVHFGDIPVTNPYDAIGKYYIAEFDVAGDSAGLVFVPSGLNYNQDRLELKISSTTSTYEAPITIPPTYLQYRQVKYAWGVPGLEWKNVNYRDVSLDSPFIHTSSNVKLSTPGNNIQTSTVIQEGTLNNVGETVKRFTVTHDGAQRTIYVKFDRLVFKSGDLPIAGDYVIFKDHVGMETLVRYDHLSSGTGTSGSCYADDWNTWNCVVSNSFVRLKFSDVDGYDDYSNWIIPKLPDKCPTSADSCNFNSNKLTIDYPSTVFTQHVTVYVPEELAEFIMVVEQTPEFDFNPILDISGNEGQIILVNVKGTAINSGTINLRMSGDGLESVKWQQSTQQTIVAGKSYTFPVSIKLAQTDTNSKLPITVYSQPLGVGVPTQTTFYANIIDTSTAPTYDLRIKCVNSNNDIVTNAEIYIDNAFTGYGDITKNVVQGNHYVYAKNVTGWYSGYPPNSPKTVSVNSDTSIEIPFTTDEPKEDGISALFLIGGIAIVAIILLSLIAREFGINITVNHVIILIIVVVVGIMGSIALEILRELIDAIKDFNLLGG